MLKGSSKTKSKGVQMIEIGRVCLKIAGRDSNSMCVVVDVLDEKTVLIDGQTRRRKCNIKHIEALDKVINVKKGASHSNVVKEFEKIGIKVEEKQKKSKPKSKKPVKKRKSKSPKKK
jgi:large subunit ribosomal protein L14e